MKNVVLGISLLAVVAIVTTVLFGHSTPSDANDHVTLESATVGLHSQSDAMVADKDNDQTRVGKSTEYVEDETIRLEQAVLESESKLKDMAAEYDRIRTDVEQRENYKEKMAAQLAEHSENVLPLALDKLRQEDSSETTE